jgi:O-antigen/teichoic acid export membrane protein
MTASHRIARSIGTNWLLLGLNVGISFFMSPFVVNKLGSTYYGIWAISLQFTGYLYLMDFGVRESVIRYTSKYATRGQGRQLNQILSTALLLYAPITLGCIALTLGCAWGVPIWFDISPEYATEAQLAVMFVGFTIAQTFIFNVFTGVLQGLGRFDIANLTGIVTTIVRSTLIVVALTLGYKLVALAAIQFFMAIVGGMIGAIAATRQLKATGIPLRLRLPTKSRFAALRRNVLGYGFYVLINNVAQKINFASDAVVIGIFMPVSFVTPYAIAGSLIDYLRQLILSTAQVFNPLSSKLYTQRRTEDLALMLIQGAKLTVIVTLPIALTFAVLGKEFVGLWMGKEYMESAGSVLLILGLTQIISAPHYVVSSVLYGMSKHRTMGFMRVGEAAANLILSIILVQRMGIVGVAYGTAISHTIVVLILLPTLVTRFVAINVSGFMLGAYFRPLIAAIPFLLGAFWLRSNAAAESLLELFVQIGALVCLYLPCVYAIALNIEERNKLKQLVGSRFSKR